MLDLHAIAAEATVDVLLNHASSIAVKPLLDTTETEWERLMAVNVMSMCLVTR